MIIGEVSFQNGFPTAMDLSRCAIFAGAPRRAGSDSMLILCGSVYSSV